MKANNGTKNTIKRVILIVFILAMIATIIGLAVTVSRSTAQKLGGEAYEIGLLNAEGKEEKGETAIRTRKGVTVDGLKCELEKDAKIKYQLFFYDKDGKFLSSSGALTADYDGKSIPEGAETVKIMITPTADEDGKVSLIEVLGYANLLTVTTDK